MRINRALRGLATCGGGTALLIGLVALPASARPLEQGTYHDVGDLMSSEDPEWPCQDLGFDVRIQYDVHGSYLLNTHGTDSLPLGRESSSGTVSYSANGHTYTAVFAIASRDISVTDNGDGTLSIVSQGAGNETWYLDGERLYQDPGMIRYELLIDANGTPADPTDDEFLAFVREVRPSTGVNNGPTGEFCDDLARFLAP